MSTRKRCDVIPLFPEKEEDSAVSGWDPYIFSIMANTNATYAEERRRIPRPLTAARRRALLIATLSNSLKKAARRDRL
jgi:hypothetical protein